MPRYETKKSPATPKLLSSILPQACPPGGSGRVDLEVGRIESPNGHGTRIVRQARSGRAPLFPGLRGCPYVVAALICMGSALVAPARTDAAPGRPMVTYQWGTTRELVGRQRTEIPRPWQVHGLQDTIALAGSESRFAVEADGSLWAWGDNASGQLGLGNRKSYRWPRRVVGIGRVSQVSASPDHTLALLANGTVMSWGDNSTGQLGDGTLRARLRPVRVRGLSDVISVATPTTGWLAPFRRHGASGNAGARRLAESLGGYSLALRRDGTVWTWGSNYFLMNGHVVNNPGGVIKRPQRVRGLSDIAAIAAGAAHAVALTHAGGVVAWGNNTFEQLGRSQAYGMATLPIKRVIGVFAGGDDTLVIREGGTVWAWGRSIKHRLPTGVLERCQSTGDACSSAPVQIQGLHHVVSIGAGDGFDYALKRGGHLLAWGDNSTGELGTVQRPGERFVRVPLPGRVIDVQPELSIGLAIVRQRLSDR